MHHKFLIYLLSLVLECQIKKTKQHKIFLIKEGRVTENQSVQVIEYYKSMTTIIWFGTEKQTFTVMIYENQQEK